MHGLCLCEGELATVHGLKLLVGRLTLVTLVGRGRVVMKIRKKAFDVDYSASIRRTLTARAIHTCHVEGLILIGGGLLCRAGLGQREGLDRASLAQGWQLAAAAAQHALQGARSQRCVLQLVGARGRLELPGGGIGLELEVLVDGHL